MTDWLAPCKLSSTGLSFTEVLHQSLSWTLSPLTLADVSSLLLFPPPSPVHGDSCPLHSFVFILTAVGRRDRRVLMPSPLPLTGSELEGRAGRHLLRFDPPTSPYRQSSLLSPVPPLPEHLLSCCSALHHRGQSLEKRTAGPCTQQLPLDPGCSHRALTASSARSA